MKITLTKINRRQAKNKETGRPFESVSIQCQEYGSRWLNGYGRKENKDWKEGDVVEVTVAESTRVDTNGQPYLNFKMPEFQKGGMSTEDHDILIRMELDIKRIIGLLTEKQTDNYDRPKNSSI